MNLEDALEDFNNGEFDKWLQVFGSYDVWFRLLKKRGLLDEIDPHNASDHEVWQNEYLLWLYESDKESYYIALSLKLNAFPKLFTISRLSSPS